MTDSQGFVRLTKTQKYLPCRDRTYTEKFFLATNTVGQDEPAGMAEAKQLCSHCPIFWECQAEGIRIQDKWGVYGGLSPADRAALLEQEQEHDLAA